MLLRLLRGFELRGSRREAGLGRSSTRRERAAPAKAIPPPKLVLKHLSEEAKAESLKPIEPYESDSGPRPLRSSPDFLAYHGGSGFLNS